MKNEHYSEAQLEALARQTESESEDSHIRQCRICRERLAFLRDFHRELQSELTKPPDPRVESLAKRLTRTHILELKPFRAHHDAETLGLGENAFLLAAQSKDTARPTDVHVAIYASEAKKTLVRIVQKKNEPIYAMHVLSDEREARGHVLIAIVDQEGKLQTIPTNENGVAELKAADLIDWGNVSLLIFTPIASFVFDGGMKPDLDNTDTGIRIRTVTEGDNVRIEVHADEERGVRHTLLVNVDGNLSLLPITSRYMTLPANTARQIHKVLFYH